MSNHRSHDKWLSELSNHLKEERYAEGTVRRCVAVARYFLCFLDRQHVELVAVQAECVELYLEQALRRYRRRHGHSPFYKGWRCLHTNGIQILLRLAQGQWPPITLPVTPAGLLQREICGEYSRWMTRFRGLSTDTISNRCAEARRFLAWLETRPSREELAALDVVDLDNYMKERAGALRRTSLGTVATAIRGFVQWLHITEITTRDLSSMVTAPSHYALENIPSVVRSKDVKRVLAMTQRDRTPKGIRDYAILMLISTYGVRAGEISSLRLDDVDWRKEIIRIRHSKTRSTSLLPMLPDTGEAILQYLRESRPVTPFREIFLRLRAPYRPFRSGSSLYGLVRGRLEAAGVILTGKRGPHSLRHSRAVSMLRAGVPAKEIGDLLGHRSADSTLVYLRLATEDLRAVAMEIPAGVKA